MSSNNFRDVHTFDGTLGQHFTSTESFTPEQKVQLFSDFRDKLHSDTSKLMIQSIIVDLDNQNNIDSTNGIDSSDILAEICKKSSHSRYRSGFYRGTNCRYSPFRTMPRR